jgi:protein-disulfide isomerase
MRQSINWTSGAQDPRRPGRTDRTGGPKGPFRSWRRAREAVPADLRHNRPRVPVPDDRRPPLSGKQRTPQTTRKERRAAERRDRFDVARDERRARTTVQGGGGSLFSTRNIMIAATLVGVLIVVLVAVNQLGNRVTGTLSDPGTAYPPALLDGATIGTAEAPVTLEVYEDFQCPFCAQYSLSTEPVLVSRYVTPGTLRIVHHDIAILGRGGSEDESKLTATGATCADREGLYWEYAHWVYNNQDGENAGGFRRERLTSIAEAAGLEPGAFSGCLDDASAIGEVATATTQATNLGINSTPTLYVNGTKINTTLSPDEIGAQIEAAAASAAPSPSASTSPAASPSVEP